MAKLSVNIDHVATVREARQALEPDPVAAAILAEHAGAHGITIHLRGDRRHIQERDARILREVVKTKLNIEMAVTEQMLQRAVEIRPDTVTLVPESVDELTTEGGLNVTVHLDEIRNAVRTLRGNDIEVSLFVDPVLEQIQAGMETGAGLVELNTAAYARAVPLGLKEWEPAFETELEKVMEAAEEASSRGLRVLAGHGLTYRNVAPVAAIPTIEELNIGHNIIARAVLVGMERAVREMLLAMQGELGEE